MTAPKPVAPGSPTWAMPVLYILLGCLMGWFGSNFNLASRLEAVEKKTHEQDIQITQILSELKAANANLEKLYTEMQSAKQQPAPRSPH
jgi:hypothetical protein